MKSGNVDKVDNSSWLKYKSINPPQIFHSNPNVNIYQMKKLKKEMKNMVVFYCS